MLITSFSINQHPFDFLHQTDAPCAVANSEMHYHGDIFELLYILKGNCTFMVEGNRYRVSGGDILITRPDEIHMMIHGFPRAEYERFNISLPGSFFTYHHCENLKTVFTNRRTGAGNLIPASCVRERNIPGIIWDMEKYCQENTAPENAWELDIVMSAKMTELLYNLNRAVPKAGPYSFSNDKISDITRYINENLASDLSLDLLSGKFFVSKGYLCSLFKAQTGMTINKYITHKRLLKVQELYGKGERLIDASALAGFHTYSTFHRMYVKEFGLTPKTGLNGSADTRYVRVSGHKDSTKIIE